jgi:O-antigen/teichoic acid export membrane protein
MFAKIHIILGFFIASLFFSESSSIINFLYGSKYIPASELLKYMSIAVVFNFAIFGYTNCLVSFGYDKVLLKVVIVSTIISIGGGFLLIPYFGAIGASVIIVLIDLFGWLVSLPTYNKVIGKVNFNDWKYPILGAIIIIFLSKFLVKIDLYFPIRICISTIIYFVFLYLVDLKKDIKSIFNLNL